MRVVPPRGRLDGRVTGGSDRNALSWVALAVVVTCIDPALAATGKTFSDPLSTVIGMVLSTGGQLAETLSVGVALLDSSFDVALERLRCRCRSTFDEGGSPRRAAAAEMELCVLFSSTPFQATGWRCMNMWTMLWVLGSMEGMVMH